MFYNTLRQLQNYNFSVWLQNPTYSAIYIIKCSFQSVYIQYY